MAAPPIDFLVVHADRTRTLHRVGDHDFAVSVRRLVPGARARALGRRLTLWSADTQGTGYSPPNVAAFYVVSNMGGKDVAAGLYGPVALSVGDSDGRRPPMDATMIDAVDDLLAAFCDLAPATVPAGGR